MTAQQAGPWPAVRMVTEPGELHRALEEWRSAGVIGVDTEANSFYAYWERLCLIQVSTTEQDYIVDPIPLGEELRAINPLLRDESVVKIFHSAEFDLMLLKKDLEAEVDGLFDTQVAMTLLNHERTGLAALIETIYGVKLSKKEQRSDWGQRPLKPEQIEYARIDTHFLPDLYARLQVELEEKDLLDAAHGEFRRLEQEVLPEREPDMEGWKRMKGVRNLDAEAGARLRALFQWRERLGQKSDRPVFRVMANPTLIDLALNPPRDMRELAQRKGIGWPKAKRMGEQVLEALNRAEGKRVEVPGRKSLSREERRRRRLERDNYEALRKWRQHMAEELGLPSERVIHRRHLQEISRKLPRNSQELLKTAPLNDWQRENLEGSLLELLAGLPDPQ